MQMYINGSWRSSKDGNEIEIVNPSTNTVIDTVPAAAAADVDEALQAAKTAKKSWARTPVWKRSEILVRFANIVRENTKELAQLLSRESGKPIAQAEDEIGVAVRLFTSFPEHAKTLYGMNIPLDSQQGIENDVYLTRREPLGVIVGIIPFNFPVDIFSHKVAPALSAGNVAIVKPPEDDPLTVLKLVEYLYEAGLPENVLQVVTGKGNVGQQLVESPIVDGISFTGSTETGIKVATSGFKHLSRVMLELGGNDPLIVFEDADLEKAVEHAIMGRTPMNGQVCCASKRMIIHRSLVDDFTKMLVTEVEKLKVGDPSEETTTIGPLIHQKALQKVGEQVELTVSQGAKVVSGGERLNNSWYVPTVLSDVNPSCDIAKDMEVFGPVFPVIAFETEEEAIAIANQSKYGLNGGVFTKDVNRAINVAYQVESGIVAVNGTGLYRPDVSFFGGYKSSGIGREGLIGALEGMTQIKSVALRDSLKIYE